MKRPVSKSVKAKTKTTPNKRRAAVPRAALPQKAPKSVPRSAAKHLKPVPRPAQASTRRNPAPSSPAAPGTRPPSASKQAQLIALLSNASGASMAQLTALTGWQRHTVRGAISGSLRKRLGLNVQCRVEEGERVYRIVETLAS